MFAGLAAGGATLLVSSHVMDEASRCERLLLMREGRLLATSGTDSLEEAFLALIRNREEVAA
jgi:ABC-2 type transport system ATP-binding protein